MNKTLVSYASTGFFSKAVTDYIEGSEKLKPFYTYAPQLASFPEIIKNRQQYPFYREELSNALIRQYEPFEQKSSVDAVKANILLLKDADTFTIVTAHQPNLFLGPLYLIYKIISTINLARQLSETIAGYHFVPVYWMGSEDHDKEELNHIHLFGKTFSWNTNQQGAFGRMKTDSLSLLIDEIKEVLGTSEEAVRCIGLLEMSYLKESAIAAATKRLLYHFFGADGLVIVDGDDHALKKLFIPVMKSELYEQFSFPIVNKSTGLFSESYTSQITPREINLFYLDDGIRNRIVKEGDTWNVLNTTHSFTADELQKLLLEQPEKFSPNVVLRPLYQELVLPNIAFIGGGAEITYWMQIKALFLSAGVAFPMLLLRNSAMWIDQANVTRMKKLNFSADIIFKPADKLTDIFLQQQAGQSISLDEERKLLIEMMERTLERAIELDGSLKGAVEAEKVKMLKSMDALEEKLKKSVKRKEEGALQQLHVLKEKLFPANSLQERYDNFIAYYLKYGPGFIDSLKMNFDPMDQRFTLLMEE
jgi:bacillithiol biosynthesis cysteine-adding enzyme BshC